MHRTQGWATRDDLARLVTDNCGSVWGQTFSYDQYDNLTKSGSLNWNPGYNSANNHYTLAGTSYDTSGNLLYDTFNTYTWNGNGKAASIQASNSPAVCGTSGTCLTYDALGRMVERSANSAYNEILYSPVGKTATMSGQTTTSAYFPLPGGETYYQSGNTGSNRYYWHKDWLGTVRLATSLGSRGPIFDRAFAPYGEMYDNFGQTGQLSFTGDTQDTFGGIFDTPERGLNPTQGRWLSPDPAGAGWNRYSYVGGNPLAYTDPSGLFCLVDYCGGEPDPPDPPSPPPIPASSTPSFAPVALRLP